MRIYRLGSSRYARVLDGAGASRYPGRWNSLGTHMIYCGGNPATCLAEQLVRLHEPPDDYVLTTLDVPDIAPVWEPNPNELPQGWDQLEYSPAIRAFGDAFVQAGEYLVLKVPSAVIPAESNFLLNPRHSLMPRVSIVSVAPFTFDPRLF